MTGLLAMNWETLFAPPNIVFVAVFGVGGVIAIIGIIAGSWAAVKKHEQDVRLKRELASKGYSVEEIERVVRAKGPNG